MTTQDMEGKTVYTEALFYTFFALRPLSNVCMTSSFTSTIFGLTPFGLFSFIEVLFAYGNIFDLRLFYVPPICLERN